MTPYGMTQGLSHCKPGHSPKGAISSRIIYN